jgi:hypothetical protein
MVTRTSQGRFEHQEIFRPGCRCLMLMRSTIRCTLTTILFSDCAKPAAWDRVGCVEMIVDLSDPDRLRATLQEMLEKSVSQSSLHALPMSQDAVEPLVLPGLSRSEDLKSIDTDLLEAAIQSIAQELTGPQRLRHSIDADAVRQAMSRSKCHYLWFC